MSVYDSHHINETTHVRSFPWKNDTLLHFYMILLDLCRSTVLTPAKLEIYLQDRQKIGKFTVHHHDRWSRPNPENPMEPIPMRLTGQFIEKVVAHCSKQGQISQKEYFLQLLGQIPGGSTERSLKKMVYYYNPENLPGLHQVSDAFLTDEQGNLSIKQKIAVPSTFFVADNQTYYFPQSYVGDDDLEKNPMKSAKGSPE